MKTFFDDGNTEIFDFWRIVDIRYMSGKIIQTFFRIPIIALFQDNDAILIIFHLNGYEYPK